MGWTRSLELLVLLIFSCALKGTESCENPYVSVGEKCLFFGNSLSQPQYAARDLCSALNGRLLQIDTPHHFKNLVDYMNNASDTLLPYWLDGTDELGEGLWLYSSGNQVPMGTPFWATWTTFQDGESQYPNADDSTRNCIGIGPDEHLYFRDFDCEDDRSPLCEEFRVSNVPRVAMKKHDNVSNTTKSLGVSNVPRVAMKKYDNVSNITKSLGESLAPRACNQDYLGTGGRILSYDYPNDYPNSANCWYRINVEDGNHIRLSFEIFETERCVDYLDIYDGSSSSSTKIAKLCGTGRADKQEIPDSFISSGTSLYMRFISDSSIHYPGFVALWHPEPDISCIEEYTSSSGQLFSPGFPVGYPHNLDCQYTITTDEDKIITLTTSFFETADADAYVQVYDGGSSSAPLLMTLSGTHHDVPVITSTSNQLFLTFHTPVTYIDTPGGFVMSWISEKACPLPFVSVGSLCMKFLFTDLTFGQATVLCITDGGSLAAINTADELRDFYLYINQYGIADADYWIGGSDLDSEDIWTWKDGTLVPMGTPFWGTLGSSATVQEPDGGIAENCLALTSTGNYFFRDLDCNTAQKAVCMFHQ